jgi:hypothetical protein
VPVAREFHELSMFPLLLTQSYRPSRPHRLLPSYNSQTLDRLLAASRHGSPFDPSTAVGGPSSFLRFSTLRKFEFSGSLHLPFRPDEAKEETQNLVQPETATSPTGSRIFRLAGQAQGSEGCRSTWSELWCRFRRCCGQEEGEEPTQEAFFQAVSCSHCLHGW